MPDAIKPLPEPMLINHQVGLCGILHLMDNNFTVSAQAIVDMSLKITYLCLKMYLPGANELILSTALMMQQRIIREAGPSGLNLERIVNQIKINGIWEAAQAADRGGFQWIFLKVLWVWVDESLLGPWKIWIKI